MAHDIISTVRKAQILNEDKSFYGSFAEIGAGQEVARYFFQAGHASQTIAKTMSAYDMTFSDHIYGKAPRYVSLERLKNMLNHEHALLFERLESKGRCFFAFANTVVTSSHQEESHSNAWMGIKFQTKENGPINEIHIHVRLLDRMRLQQQEALGVLGVNLIYATAYLTDTESLFVSSLIDNLSADRAQVDYIDFVGEDLKHLNVQMAGLQLLAQKMSQSLIFVPGGKVVQSTDFLYGKSVVILRGTYAPITKTNLDILKKAEDAAQKFVKSPPCTILEFTMDDLEDPDDQPYQDFLARIKTINACGQSVMVTVFPLFYQVKSYLRSCTKESICIVVGAAMLEKLFDSTFYKNTLGGILFSFGKLFDKDSKILVFPYKTKKACLTAKSFFPEKSIDKLYKYFCENDFIVDIDNCDDLDTSVLSSDVRQKLNAKDPTWKKSVPEVVVKMIEENGLFGYKN